MYSYKASTFKRNRKSAFDGHLTSSSFAGSRTQVRQALGVPLQAKLTVGAPNDKYEQEADRVADQVMAMPDPKLQRQAEGEEEEEPLQTKPLADQITPLVQRQEEPPEEEEKPVQAKFRDGGMIQRMCPECDDGMAQWQPTDNEEEEEEVQAKSKTGETPTVTRNLESRINGLRSGGQTLDPFTRAFFEPRFGRDFSQVRVYTDAQASETARALNAQAFTVGRDVVIGAGKYAPETSQGKRLIGHELVHVVQQTGRGRGEVVPRKHINTDKGRWIQRKITIGGKPFTPSRFHYWGILGLYKDAMVEFVKKMHNRGKPPDYKFNNYRQYVNEIKMRYNAIKGMEETAKGCCNYPSGSGTGYLNSTYWKKISAYTFIIKPPLPVGKGPSDAIEAIFKSGAGTELECNSMMVAVHYRAMLKMLGKTKFNTKFAQGSGIIISPALKKFRYRIPQSPPAWQLGRHPIWKYKLFKRITITGLSDLLPGDWVYFKNFSDYRAKHPGGYWTGEHMVYVGNKKFSGFGLQNKTEQQVNTKLLSEYNSGLPAAHQKTTGLPGLLKFARRPVINEIEK